MSYLAQPTSKLEYGIVKVGDFINVNTDGIISIPEIVSVQGIAVEYADDQVVISAAGADVIATVGIDNDYDVTDQDEYIGVNCQTACTVRLPAGQDGRTYTIKNEADRNNTRVIIVSQVNELIDGAESYEIKLRYQSINLVFRGDQWRII
jgi:hypothetical protein